MVFFSNKNITIYRFNEKKQTYKRINVDNVNCSNKRNATIGENGVNVFYTTTIILDNQYSPIFLKDKIVLDHLEQDINKLTDLKNVEILTVVGVKNNTFFNSLVLECK